MASKRVVSMLTLYKNEVFPLLVERGFVGTVARSEKKLARGQCFAHASGQAGVLDVAIDGYFAAPGFKTAFAEKLDVVPAERDAAIRALRKRMLAVLDAIEADDAASPVREVTSLADALHALLERLAKRLGGTITRVEQKGRTLVVHAPGHPAPVVADRAMLLTLANDLWGDAAFPAGRDSRYAVREVELAGYIAQLAAVDAEEARALYVHLHTAYATHFEADASNPIARLFPTPVWAAKHLNTGATATSLVRRALPHTTKGTLTDRVAAFSVITTALISLNTSDAGFGDMNAELDKVIGATAGEKAPLLPEAAWLLQKERSRDDDGL